MKVFHMGVALTLSLLQAGCGIGGHWMTGISGQAREDYLKSIKPHLQYYEKSGWTAEGRRRDSAECGGPPNESIQFGSNAIKVAQLPGETERQTEMRLRQAWYACMVEKGYRDTRAVPQ